MTAVRMISAELCSCNVLDDKRHNWLSAQLVDVIPLMWQRVSNSKCHFQASGLKYLKGILYNCMLGT